MIPRTIHCCWLGGAPKTPLALKCRESWTVFAPGWKVREWRDEDFYSLSPPAFALSAVAARKWAFAADWLRFASLYAEGGVYFDSDMELVAPLEVDASFVAGQFMPGGGTGPEPAAMALEKGSPVAAAMLEEYARLEFDMSRTVGEILTEVLEKKGLSLEMKRREVFCPIDLCGKMHITPETVGIHRCAMSWIGPGRRFARWLSWHGMRFAVDAFLAARNFLSRNAR